MTIDLEKLTEALKRDTPEKLLEQQIERQKQEIVKAVSEGRDFVLEGTHRLVIKKAS